MRVYIKKLFIGKHLLSQINSPDAEENKQNIGKIDFEKNKQVPRESKGLPLMGRKTDTSSKTTRKETSTNILSGKETGDVNGRL